MLNLSLKIFLSYFLVDQSFALSNKLKSLENKQYYYGSAQAELNSHPSMAAGLRGKHDLIIIIS